MSSPDPRALGAPGGGRGALLGPRVFARRILEDFVPVRPHGMLQDPITTDRVGVSGLGCGTCSSAAPGRGWAALARPRPPRARLPRPLLLAPGPRINCSCFPSLTALLLAGTNCESPQEPRAASCTGRSPLTPPLHHPPPPPAPGFLCYSEFRISCSRRVLGGVGTGGGTWARIKIPRTWKGAGAFSTWNLSRCSAQGWLQPRFEHPGGRPVGMGVQHSPPLPHFFGGGFAADPPVGPWGGSGAPGFVPGALNKAEPSQSSWAGALGPFLFPVGG